MALEIEDARNRENILDNTYTYMMNYFSAWQEKVVMDNNFFETLNFLVEDSLSDIYLKDAKCFIELEKVFRNIWDKYERKKLAVLERKQLWERKKCNYDDPLLVIFENDLSMYADYINRCFGGDSFLDINVAIKFINWYDLYYSKFKNDRNYTNLSIPQKVQMVCDKVSLAQKLERKKDE